MNLYGYDSLVASLIPGYASLARLSVSLLAASPRAQAKGASVLVAGCGSGSELLEARTLRPDWTLTGLDPSPAMLAMAQQKLQSQPDGADGMNWIQGTVEDLPAQPTFDGAMAVLVLQSLPDDGSKLRFLSSLSRSLRSGAQVVLVDQMQPERNGIEEQLVGARRIFQRLDGGVENPQSALEALGEVHPISVARLTGLLEASGFSDPFPVFRALDFEGFLLQRLP
jgi:tRNA (cmo5U34)-methyltransferase